MSLKQAYDTSELLLKDFHDWKLADVQLCFDRAKAGRYGKSYDRIDVQVVLDWCSQYDLERMEEIAMMNEKKSGEFKQALKVLPEQFMPILESVVVKQVAANPKPRTMDRQSELFNIWYRNFDRIYFKRGFDSGGIRCINHKGKSMTGLDYVNYRFEKLNKLINAL